VLVWLLWVLLAVLGAILLVWAFVIAAVVIGGAASVGRCPNCGLSLEITDGARFLDAHLDARYGGSAYDHCIKCGWRRSKDR
jgi:hypothetical protein